MELKDFKIGKYFFTANGKWQCTDIGTRTIDEYEKIMTLMS